MRLLARSRSVAIVAALATATLGTSTLTVAARAGSPDAPGLVGGRVLLENHASYSGFDAATDNAGYTYIGWIGTDDGSDGATREVRVCTLAPLGSQCLGGIQVIDSMGVSSAEGLRVLATGQGATLVWFHDTDLGSISGPEGAELALADVGENGVATAPSDFAAAPSFGELYDAEISPSRVLWTVAGGSAGTGPIEVRDGASPTPIELTAPWDVQGALLAFQGSTPVIAAQKAGGITYPVQTAYGVGAGFSAFAPVAKTWTSDANIGLVGTKTGVRLTASVGNADYWPVISKFTGSGFSKPVPTGDTADCSPSSHDLVSDASGRVADVANECGNLTVYDMPNTVNESLFRFSSGGIDASGNAQITTTPRGHGVVVWAIEAGDNGNALYFNRILLAGRDTSVSHSGVTVTGPTSCQPASTIAVSVKGRRSGWKVSSASLSLGGKTLGSKATIDGATLTAGKVYALVGRVVFTKGTLSSVGTETLKFRSCINP